MPIVGSEEEFPDCPAYYLRTAGELPAAHLLDGAIHPMELASVRANEIKNGAITSDDLTPKMLEAALVYCREDASKTKYESEQRREARGARR